MSDMERFDSTCQPSHRASSGLKGLLLLLLLQSGGLVLQLLLLVLAPLVLEPDPDHARTQPRDLHQVLLHQRVRAGVGVVHCTEGLELLLGEDRSHAGTLLRVGALGRGPAAPSCGGVGHAPSSSSSSAGAVGAAAAAGGGGVVGGGARGGDLAGTVVVVNMHGICTGITRSKYSERLTLTCEHLLKIS